MVSLDSGAQNLTRKPELTASLMRIFEEDFGMHGAKIAITQQPANYRDCFSQSLHPNPQLRIFPRSNKGLTRSTQISLKYTQISTKKISYTPSPPPNYRDCFSQSPSPNPQLRIFPRSNKGLTRSYPD